MASLTEVKKVEQNPSVDYSKSEKPMVVCRFITEVCNKLKAKVQTNGTALVFYHRYNLAQPSSEYDPYLMATACIYVAGKLEEPEHLRIRDLINVVHTTLHRGEDPLEIDDEYHATREAIVQAELFLLRMIGFNTGFAHHYKYLLHYLKSLKDWIAQDVWEKYPVDKTSWALLQDFYHDPAILEFHGSLVSLSCIQIALQTYGIAIPYNSSREPWHLVFNPKATTDALWEVMTRIMEVYNKDLSFVNPITKP